MKFYRLAKRYDHGSSAGYTWHSNKSDAELDRRETLKEDPEEYEQFGLEIQVVEITPTKVGILKALKMFASYPNNG